MISRAASCSSPLDASPLTPPAEGHAVQTRELPARLAHDHHRRRHVPQRHRRIAGQLGGPLGDEHVLPEISVPARPPAPRAELQQRVETARRPPVLQAAEAELRVGKVPNARDLQPARLRIGAFAHERPAAGGRPPPPPQRGGRDDADRHLAVLLQRQQRRPDRHAAHVALGAVDRVHDPAPAVAGRRGRAVLLAEDRIAWPRGRQPLAHRLLGGAVGVRDRRHVRLGLDREIGGAKARQRDRVGNVGQLVRQRKVVCGRGHVSGCYADTLQPMSAEDLHRESVELLQELVRFDTVNPPGNERPAIEHLDRYLRAAGFETEILAARARSAEPGGDARRPGRRSGPVPARATSTRCSPTPRNGATIHGRAIWPTGSCGVAARWT